MWGSGGGQLPSFLDIAPHPLTQEHSVTASTRTRRLLVPLATLVAAAGIVVASGATFSTSTASTASAASGVLKQTNSNSVAFTGVNLKPGDVVKGSVTITNSGTLPAVFTLTETEGVNSFAPKSDLTVQITENGPAGTRALPASTLGALPQQSLGEFAVGEQRTYAYVVTFNSGALNAQQNKSATTTYTFSSVQTAGQTYDGTQSGVEVTNP